MCDKPNVLIREAQIKIGVRKDNLPLGEYEVFNGVARPCICGGRILGSVPGGHFWYEVELI